MTETTTRIADYVLLESFDFGHGGELYAAAPPPRLGIAAPRVLLKVVSGVTGEVELRRAADELRTFATVRSPYLAELLDAGQYNDDVFYAMSFPEGGTLEKPTNALTDRERLEAVARASRGVHALHESGIAHRNITPSSILLGDSGAELANLGMAKAIRPEQSVSRMPSLSDIDYLDPTVMLGNPHSRATDIWSLGVVLHWVMSDGSPIHPGRSAGDAFVAVRQVLAEPPMISPRLPPFVRPIVSGALSVDPADRPGTAEQLAVQIETLLEENS